MTRALMGVRVLDLAGGVAGGYCSRLLADLGAEVILVEPPAGDPTRRLGPFPTRSAEPGTRSADGSSSDSALRAPRSALEGGLFLALHHGKRLVTADLARPDDAALVRRLLADTDVVITAQLPEELAAAGLDLEALRAGHPPLVQVCITHYGLTGPYRAWKGDEITDYALGGYHYFGGDPEREPLLVPGYQAWHHAGMQGALAALVALAERDRSGLGQLADISAVEAMLSAHSWTSVAWSHGGQVMGRTPSDLIPCADGWVYFMLTNLEGIAVLIERYDLPQDPRFATIQGRVEHRAALHAMLAAWCAGRTMEDIYRAGQELRVAVTPVHTVRDLFDSPQLTARAWFREMEHPELGTARLPGAPFRLTGADLTPRPPSLHEKDEIAWEPRSADAASPQASGRAAQYRDQAAAPDAPPFPVREGGLGVRLAPSGEPSRELPLSHLRVVELTANWAGPLAGRYLADLGAEVIKVEAPHRPATRALHYAGNDPRTRPYNRSGYFNKLNRNKLGVVLDLARPRGRELFLDLVRRADVVIENNSARVLGNLGIGYDVLRGVKPDIILCSMSGFGGTGPERDYVAYGSNIETVCGLAALMAYHDDPAPHRTGSYYADPVAGALGAVAVLAALRHRDRTGEGQWIDLSLLESAAALFSEALMEWSLNGRLPLPRGNRHAVHAPQGVYPCAGADSWLALTVRDHTEWEALCRVIGRADLTADAALATPDGRRQKHDLLDEAIAAWSRGLDHYEAARTLQAAGVPAAPVLANWELLSDPHLHARGFYVPVPHPEVGVLPFPGFPWRFSRTPGVIRSGAPCFGEHNRLVFRDILGLTDAQIDGLYAERITADEPLAMPAP